MKTLAKPILAILSAAWLAGCATSPTGRSQLLMLPDQQISEMGLRAFQNIKGELPIVRDQKANEYVRCVAGPIAREVGGSWEVVVFEDGTPNAFALPGGKIGVYTGILPIAQNQHQLAAVIGHEIAHVIARHSNERVSQEFAVTQGLQLLGALGNPQSATGRQLMGLLGVGAQVGILLPYGRTQESEADVIGLDLMARAGFDPRQAVALWHNMERTDRAGPPEFLSTHPSHGTRIAELQATMPRAMGFFQQAQVMGKVPQCDAMRR